MPDLLPALVPLVSRARQDVTWRKIGRSISLEKNTPVSKTILKRHLRGIEQRGVCPIHEDSSTTQIAVLDLDNHKAEITWQQMIFVCSKVYHHFLNLGYPSVPCRSSSGRGIHLYFLWDNPQDAYSLRRFFTVQLETLGIKNGTKGVANGEIEIFPKQDVVPKGGYGNQFILPFSDQSVPLEPLAGFEPQPKASALDITWPISDAVPVIDKPDVVRARRQALENDLSPEIKKMLEAIPNEETNYDLWIKIGMVLHTESGGSEEGLALWEEWSSRCPEYSGYDELQYKWNSFRDDKEAIVAIGSLRKIAVEHGYYEDYSVDFEDVTAEAELPPVVIPRVAPSFESEHPAVIVGETDDVKEAPEAGKKKAGRFAAIDADKFMNRPAPHWLIKGILPSKSTGMTYGGSGDGKTFLVLDLAISIALGLPWRGRRTRRGVVFYICAEGAGSFQTRLWAYALHHGIDMQELGKYFKIIPASPNFMQKKEVEELVAEINTKSAKVDLIIIDTMAQTTTGADENSAKDMNIALKLIEQLRRRTNSAVHLIHHAGKNEERGARGSSVLKAALDVQFQVSRKGDVRTFWVTKMKDGIDGFGWNFYLRPRDIGIDEDGDIVTSCYLEFEEKIIDQRPVAKKAKDRRSDMEKLILQVWEDMGGAAVSVNDLVRMTQNQLPDIDGKTNLREINTAFRKLVASGEISVEGGQVVNDLACSS